MSQNRKPPAYQEYAASMMATNEYRVLSLSERGLLYTMRLECWVNQKLPRTPLELAKVLGFTESEISNALPRIMHFFQVKEGHLISPELADYRTHLDQIRMKQSQGGKKGATLSNQHRKKIMMQNDDASVQVSQGSTLKSLVKLNQDKFNSNSIINEGISDEEHKRWIEEYDSTQSTT